MTLRPRSQLALAVSVAWLVCAAPSLADPAAGSSAIEPAALDGASALRAVPVLTTPDLGIIRDAATAYRRDDLTGGDRLRAGVADPSARAMLDWVAIRFGGPLVDFDRVTTFTRAHPDWPGGPWLRRRSEETLLAEHKPAATVRAFFARERPRTSAGKVALALAFRSDSLDEDAATLVRQAWREDQFGPELETRILNEFPTVLTLADHRFRMERLLFKENWEAARRAAGYAGKGYDALVKARIAVNARSPQAGKLLDAVPTALRSDTSYIFSRAQFLRRADKAEEAAKVVADVTKDPAVLVDGDEWWVERRLIARKLLDTGDAKAAYAVTEGQGAESPEKRMEAEFQGGWIALRFLDDPAGAARHFDRVAALAGTPISIARAAYWQGRTARAAGRETEARALFAKAARQSITYYGQLAAAQLGESTPPLRPTPDPAGGSKPGRSRAADAVALLYAAGLRDLAMPLLLELGRSSADVHELGRVGETAEAYHDARALVLLGKAATQRGLPLDDEAYPTIGIPPFEPVGPKVEKAMVYAIARQESVFDPAAKSSVGARGLMQLMPATAQLVAKKVGVDFDAANLGDAAYNARLGAAHLGDLMNHWKGSYILTFASYNAGPGNVRKWIAAYGDPRQPDIDPVDWVERIPFSETRNYVQRVMENLEVYRKRLDARSATLIAEDLKRGDAAR